jgi:K+-transporting ATPase ATPase A chain
MHGSFTALGGMIPMINMQLGEVIIGGVGAGFYGILLFVVVAIFVAGLMVGRTPEYLGKKIEAKEVKMAMLAILCLPLAMLASRPSRWCCRAASPRSAMPARTASRRSSTPIPRRRRITARPSAASAATRPGTTSPRPRDADRPLPDHHPGAGDRRLAGGEETVPASAGTFPTDGPLFVGLLVGVILIVGGLTFFPALALGPIVEHLAMIQGQSF